jgi:uncharacterized protein DUF1344
MRSLVRQAVMVAVVTLAFVPLAWAADVHGTVKGMDASGRVLVLEDGTQLAIPDNVRIDRRDLQPGAEVKASYNEVGGQKIITSIEVTPAGNK